METGDNKRRMTSRANIIATGPADTLEDALIRRIAIEHYPKLRESFQKIIRQQLDADRHAVLKKTAINSWRQTLAHLKGAGGNPALIQHISTQILPFIRGQEDLAKTLFLILFFKDDLRQVKRAWCPSDDNVLTNLGFPYAMKPVTRGLPGIRGLATWEVEFTEEDRRGLRGNLKHQYCSDLTHDQFHQSTYHPEGDWLVGIKSAIFLGVPVAEPDFRGRVGQICLGSPVPNLFGNKDQREGEPESDDFFRQYLDRVPLVQETRPFCQVFQDCVTYRETGASQLASAWMIQTVALTHKHRREAMYMDSRASVLDDFLRFALDDPRLRGLVDDFNRTSDLPALRPKTLAGEISFLRSRIASQRRFYEFLRHFSYQCLREVGAPPALIDAKLRDLDADIAATDSDRITSFKTQRDFRRYIRDLVSFIATVRERPFQRVEWVQDTAWEPLIDIQESGAIEYVIYQLLDNAEKNSPRNAPIICSAKSYLDESGDCMLEFTLSNRIRLPRPTDVPGTACSRCTHIVSSVATFKEKAFCADCLSPAIREFFDRNRWSSPKHTGGFGLFLVQQFVELFYNGRLSARVENTLPFSVSFSLAVPVRASQRREVKNAK